MFDIKLTDEQKRRLFEAAETGDIAFFQTFFHGLFDVPQPDQADSEFTSLAVDDSKPQLAEKWLGILYILKQRNITIIETAISKKQQDILDFIRGLVGKAFSNYESEASLYKKTIHGLTLFHWNVLLNAEPAALDQCRDRGYLTDKTDDKGRTPLYLAAFYGHDEVVRWFLSQPTRFDRFSGDTSPAPTKLPHQNALHAAALNGHITVARRLVAAGFDVGATDERGFTPLHEAVRGKHRNVIEFLLGQSPTIIHAKVRISTTKPHRENGFTPLHYAASSFSDYADLESFKLLLSAKPMVDDTSDLGETALHLSCERGNPGMVGALLDAGYSPTKTANDGRSPLHYAVVGGNVAVTHKLLIKIAPGQNLTPQIINHPFFADNMTMLHLAAASGQLEMVRWLLNENKAEIDKADGNARTALHHAAMNGHEAIVEELLTRRDKRPVPAANSQIKDSQHKEAIHYAITGGCINIVKRLLREIPVEERARKLEGGFVLLDQVKNQAIRQEIFQLLYSESYKQKAEAYLKKREADPRNTYHYGWLTSIGGGYEKEPKLKAVRQWLKVLNKEATADTLKEHMGPLTQGELGDIFLYWRLAEYIEHRKGDSRQYYHWTWLSKLFGGRSKDVKVPAAEALQSVVIEKQDRQALQKHIEAGAFNGGELGDIFKAMLKKPEVFPELHASSARRLAPAAA